MFAGINGAGKSTLFELQKMKYNADFGVRVCPDDILMENEGDWENYNDVYASGRKACKKINDCLEKKESFNWEYTLITDYVLKIMQKAKDAGYQIKLNFILVDDLQTSLDRVAERVKNGGHGISEDMVRWRFKNQFMNMEKALPMLDIGVFFDNDEALQVVGFVTQEQPLVFFDKDTEITRDLLKKAKSTSTEMLK